MNSIIVATDFSEEARNASEFAGPIAKQLGTKILLFNSFTVPIHLAHAQLSADSIAKLEEKNKGLLQERANELSEAYGIEVEYEARLLREVEEELEKLFSKHDALFIVMGMASKSFAQDIFGNTTTSAIMRLQYPVLAVPKTAVFKGMNKILFAYDELRKEAHPALEKIKKLALAFDAEVEVFHVYPKGKEGGLEIPGKEQIQDVFKEVKHNFKKIGSLDVIEELQKEIKSIDANLLIMIPQHHGFWESFIHRSKTRMMASGSDIPLLSIPM